MPAEKKRVRVTEAGQGVTGHNMRYVLGVSLGTAALVLIALAVAFVV